MQSKIKHCGWRFYFKKFFNAKHFLKGVHPYSASMSIKAFTTVDCGSCSPSLNPQNLLEDTAHNTYPDLMWKFGPDLYEPYRYAYGCNNELKPFDYKRDLVISRVSDGEGDFCDFVEQQCRADGSSLQSFCEALQIRYVVGSKREIHVRMTYNHALVDGIMIIRFAHARERELQKKGAHVRELSLRDGQSRMSWESDRTQFYVQDLSSRQNDILEREGLSYPAILYQILQLNRRRGAQHENRYHHCLPPRLRPLMVVLIRRPPSCARF